MPRVLLNCAASLDGKLANPDGSPLLLSGPEDLRRVHEMRADCDAIMVGIGTILADDPSLLVKKEWAAGAHPLRVVVDSKGRTPANARVLDGSAKTLILHGSGVVPAAGDHAEVAAGPAGIDLADALSELDARGVASLMVEGGSALMQSFIDGDLVDEWTLYQAPLLVGSGPSLPRSLGRLRCVGAEPLGDGVLWRFSR